MLFAVDGDSCVWKEGMSDFAFMMNGTGVGVTGLPSHPLVPAMIRRCHVAILVARYLLFLFLLLRLEQLFLFHLLGRCHFRPSSEFFLGYLSLPTLLVQLVVVFLVAREVGAGGDLFPLLEGAA